MHKHGSILKIDFKLKKNISQIKEFFLKNMLFRYRCCFHADIVHNICMELSGIISIKISIKIIKISINHHTIEIFFESSLNGG